MSNPLKVSSEIGQSFHIAQRAMADLKAAVFTVLQNGPEDGMRNADISRLLGLHSGHAGHEGHITRTVIALMETDGVLVQDASTKCWSLRFPDSRDDNVAS